MKGEKSLLIRLNEAFCVEKRYLKRHKEKIFIYRVIGMMRSVETNKKLLNIFFNAGFEVSFVLKTRI